MDSYVRNILIIITLRNNSKNFFFRDIFEADVYFSIEIYRNIIDDSIITKNGTDRL